MTVQKAIRTDMAKQVRILLLIGALMLLAAVSSRAQTDPGIPDTLRIDDAVAFTNTGSGVLPVYLFNDEELAYFELTLEMSSSAIDFDSVSFVGTRFEDAGFRVYRDLDSSTTFTLGAQQTTDLLPAGSGLAARIYFSFETSITPMTVTFDTTTFLTPSNIEYSTTVSEDPFDPPFVPQFVPGSLTIEEPPPILDSVWIADVQSEPTQSFAADVHLFNETDILNMQLSLDYGSPYLSYDSVSFTGVRGASANSKQVFPFTSMQRLQIQLDWTEGSPLTPGDGVLMRLHFTVDSTAVDTSITIDTAIGQNNFITQTAAAGGEQFTPIFNSGIVSIQISTDVGDDPDQPLPDNYYLSQNYPNPFNPTTYIEFSIPQAGHVRLDVFNVLGRRVRTLLDDELSAGMHRVMFDGRSETGGQLSTGVYLYRLSTESYTESKKMLMMK
ncbi:T9SS type A sorting domain-containing protein [candidate division GN15 bacterium]|nr:T9SS type A sorting domain-containing protein [candidate division GN15 bacterium]